MSVCIISLSSVQVVSWRTRSICHCLHLAQRLAFRERGCLWQRADSMRLLVVPVTWMRTSDASPEVVLPDQLISWDSLFGGEIDWLLLSAVRSICELELLISLWQFKEANLLSSLLKLRRTLSRLSLLAASSRLHALRQATAFVLSCFRQQLRVHRDGDSRRTRQGRHHALPRFSKLAESRFTTLDIFPLVKRIHR